MGGEHVDEWFVSRAKTIFKPKYSKPWNAEVYMHLVMDSRFEHAGVARFVNEAKSNAVTRLRELPFVQSVSNGRRIVTVANKQNVEPQRIVVK